MTVRPYFFRDDLPEDARDVITTAMESMMRKDAPVRTGFLIFQKALIRVSERHWLSADAAKPPTAKELCAVISESHYFRFLNGGGDSAARMAAMRQAQAEEYGDSSPGLIAIRTSSDEIDEGGSEPCEAGLISARNQTLQAIRALMESAPNAWPEYLAAIAGTACDLDCGSLDLLADASVQEAAKAHKRRHEQSG